MLYFAAMPMRFSRLKRMSLRPVSRSIRRRARRLGAYGCRPQKYNPLRGVLINMVQSAKCRFRDDLGGWLPEAETKRFQIGGADVDRRIDAAASYRNIRPTSIRIDADERH